MFRIVKTKTLLALKGQLLSEQERGKFLEAKGGEAIEKARQLADMLGKVATWLAANVMASGRTFRILSAKEIAQAAGFDLAAEPDKDGGVKVSVVLRPQKGRSLTPGEMIVVGTTPDANPKPRTVNPEPQPASSVEVPAEAVPAKS